MIRRLQSHEHHSDAKTHKTRSLTKSLPQQSVRSTSENPEKKQRHSSHSNPPQDKIDLSKEAQNVLQQYTLAKRTFEKLQKDQIISKISSRLCLLCIFIRYLLAKTSSFEEMAIWQRENFVKASEDLIWLTASNYGKRLFLEEKSLAQTPTIIDLPHFTLETSCFVFCNEETETDSDYELYAINFTGHLRSTSPHKALQVPLHIPWQMILPAQEKKNIPKLANNLSTLKTQITDIFDPAEIKEERENLHFFLSNLIFDSHAPDLPLTLQGISFNEFLEAQHISLKL